MDDLTTKLAEKLRAVEATLRGALANAQNMREMVEDSQAAQEIAREALRQYEQAKAQPVQDERAAFEAWLRDNSQARLWNTTDAMFAAFLGGRAATPAPAEPVGSDVELRAIGEALLAAHDQLEMHKLERSHCNSAATIRNGLATYSAWKKRGDMAATPAPEPHPDATRLDWLESVTHKGYAPQLVYDDNGNWAVSFDGVMPVPQADPPDEPLMVSARVEPHEWRNTAREAIDAARAGQGKEAP